MEVTTDGKGLPSITGYCVKKTLNSMVKFATNQIGRGPAGVKNLTVRNS